MDSRSRLRFVTILTCVRFPLVLVFFVGAIVYAMPRYRVPWLFWTTFASLIASAVTDLFDGYFARRFNVVTRLGAHVDPLMDKFFYLASLPLLVYLTILKLDHRMHATLLLVLTLLFLARDQWVMFLRSIGAMFNQSGAAHWSGKLRTAIAFPMICAIYYYEEAPAAVQFVSRDVIYLFELVGIIVNAMSLYTYTRRYWPSLRRAIELPGAGGPPA